MESVWNIVLRGQAMSNQHIYGHRGRIRYMKSDAKKLKAIREDAVRIQWQGMPVLSDEIFLVVRYFHKNKIRRDIDNYGKLVLDCMEGIVFEDDYQISQMLNIRLLDRSDPRVEIDLFLHSKSWICQLHLL